MSPLSPRQGQNAAENSSSAARPSELPRDRYLRACDRCRGRKVRCDNEYPCKRCAKAGVECTFDIQLRVLTSSSNSKKRKPSERGSDEVEQTAPKKPVSKSAPEGAARRHPVSSEQGRHLDDDWSATFFAGDDGQPRMMGQGSAVSVLDAARRIFHVKRGRPGVRKEMDGDWDYLARLLEGRAASPEAQSSSVDQEDYFPTHSYNNNETTEPGELLNMVTSVLPFDLLPGLLKNFFEIVHPNWPILHATSFFEALDRWADPAYCTLLCSMCMLASRYSEDPRILRDDSGAAAGEDLHSLFRRLAALPGGTPMYSCIAHLYAAQFFCTGSVSGPLSVKYFGTACALHIDLGLNRKIPDSVPMSAVDREIGKRAAWAIFCWDKQITALFGRDPYIRLGQMHIDLPQPYEVTDDPSILQPLSLDAGYIDIFTGFISVSSIVDYALDHLSGRARFPHSSFLDRVVMTRPEEDSEEGLTKASELLEQWRSEQGMELRRKLTMDHEGNGSFTLALEQLAGTESMLELLITSNRLFVDTLNGPGVEADDETEHDPQRGHLLRAPVLKYAKDIIHTGIKLGSAFKLAQIDMLFVYRILSAGRTILACKLTADVDGHQADVVDAQQALQAASMLLHRIVDFLPIALGAAETLDETCRVCGYDVRSKLGLRSVTMSRKAWFRVLHRRHRPDGGQKKTTMSLSSAQPYMPLAGTGDIEGFGSQTGTVSPEDPFGGATDELTALGWLFPGAIGQTTAEGNLFGTPS